MIIDKIVQVKITNRVKTYYLNLGYDVSKNIIGVKVSDLSNGSHIKINVKCDNCLVEKKIGYKYYLSYLRNDVYYCSLCNKIHREETNRLKYGVDYFMQTDEYNLLVTKTSIKKYGVEHFTQDEIYKKRKKEIYYEKNGVEHPIHLKEIKEKIKKTSNFFRSLLLEQRGWIPTNCLCTGKYNALHIKLLLHFYFISLNPEKVLIIMILI